MTYQFNITIPSIELFPVNRIGTNEWTETYVRWAAQAHHYSNGKYASPSLSTLEYVYNTYGDLLEIEAEEKGLEFIPYGWFANYSGGYWSAKTAQFVFSDPNMLRKTMIIDTLKDTGYLPQLNLRPHSASYNAFKEMASKFSYDKFGDANRLSGSYRGNFICQRNYKSYVEFAIITILRVNSESLFRTRECVFKIEGNSIQSRWDAIDRNEIELLSCTDGFASFGTNYGRMWTSVSPSSHSHLEGFEWMTKGRRCTKFYRYDNKKSDEPTDTFMLTKYPAHIELANKLLNSCE